MHLRQMTSDQHTNKSRESDNETRYDLLAGGIDGGTEKHVITLAERIRAARPRTRPGRIQPAHHLCWQPRSQITDHRIIEKHLCFRTRRQRAASMEKENLGPARDKIHDLFMEHVMAQAPGYGQIDGVDRYTDHAHT